MNELLLAETQKDLIELTINGWYAKQYVKYEKTYWPDIINWVEEDFKGKQGLKCLDIGCGYGTLLVYCQKLLDSKSYCINDSIVFLDKKVIAKYKITAATKNIELDDFPFEEKFEIVLLTAVMEHFCFYPVPTFKKIRDHLANEGTFYLSVPDSSSKEWKKLNAYFKSIDEMPLPKQELYIDGGHHYHYSKEELERIMDESGLEIKRMTNPYGIWNLTLKAK